MSVLLPIGSAAQDAGFWIQIEALPTVARAQDRAQEYSVQIPDVASFDIGSGWFGITLGPYSRTEAQGVLRQLRGSQSIPADSFVVETRVLRDQIWPPEGAQVEAVAPDEPAILPPLEGVPTIVITDADETLEQSRTAERALSQDEKKDLQTALEWAGFYTSTIDGLFGRGTRNSMAAWQESNNFQATGVLSTNQRRMLMGRFNAVLDGMDMRIVRDTRAGIEIEMPLGVVQLSEYTPPFASYTARGTLPASVVLISQPGNQDRLFGLYEIMQTLEIVPANGERSRASSSFEIEGVNGTIHSYTYATLSAGNIKGFTLVWPAGDDERRSRVLGLMRRSFNPIEGVLDPSAVEPGDDQSLDLVSGLAVRQPVRARSGFYIDGAGTVLTSADAVDSCTEVMLDNLHPASVVHLDADLGVAVLTSPDAIAPRGVAQFQTGTPRLQADVVVAGYPFGGVLQAPSLSFGTLADIRGLEGEDDIYRLDIDSRDGEAGGPVFNTSGNVIGMLLANDDSARALPDMVRFAADAPAIMASLDSVGISYSIADTRTPITPERLTRQATPVTVLVTCLE